MQLRADASTRTGWVLRDPETLEFCSATLCESEAEAQALLDAQHNILPEARTTELVRVAIIITAVPVGR